VPLLHSFEVGYFDVHVYASINEQTDMINIYLIILVLMVCVKHMTTNASA